MIASLQFVAASSDVENRTGELIATTTKLLIRGMVQGQSLASKAESKGNPPDCSLVEVPPLKIRFGVLLL